MLVGEYPFYTIRIHQLKQKLINIIQQIRELKQTEQQPMGPQRSYTNIQP